MDWLLIALILLAIPAFGVAGFVLALGGRRRIEALERRVLTLESALARRAALDPAPAGGMASAATPAEPAPEKPSSAPTPRPAAAAKTLPPVAARTPKIAATPARAGRSLEERLGARWSVVVGGLALALGGVFLARYSIEQGWLGPAARIALGALFSAGLLVFGERLRRSEARAGKPRRAIDIPAIITSAGATSAFATVYAGHALYGFLPPAAAFVALGLVAVATLAAAALHGPMLGAVGLIGAYGAPLFVSSDAPNVWALFSYLLFPTTAAFSVARLRGWPPIALAAGLAAFVWSLLAMFGGAPVGAGPLLVYATALIALTALMHSSLSTTPPLATLPEPVACALIGLFGLIAVAAAPVDGFGAAALVGSSIVLALMLAVGAWAPGLAAVAPIAAVLAALLALAFDEQALAAVAEAASLPGPGEIVRTAGTASFLAFAGAIGATFLAGGAAAARLRPATPPWWSGLLAAAAVAAPLALVAIAYWRVSSFAPDLRFAGIATLLAGAFALLAEDAARREPSGAASPMATAAYTTGAAAALGLALAMAMREGALTVALAFLAMACGFVAAKRPVRALGWLAIAAAAIVLVRIVLDPRIVGDGLGTTPIFNALLWGYGAPAIAFWLGARAFRAAGHTLASTVLESLALLFALLLGFMQARHLTHGGALDGDLARGGAKLVEVGLDATIAFALSALAGRLGLGRASPALTWGAPIAGGLGVVMATLGLLFGANPYLTGEPVAGGGVLNDLLPGYLTPALAAVAAARFTGEGRPVWAPRALGGAALLLAFGYLTLMVRRAFVGPVLSGGFSSDAEWYCYSAAWLVFGLVLLAAGVVRRSQMLRLASALVIVVVVLKVFLFDLAGLGGALRSLSFIGLGGVLIGVGLVYQRLLSPRPAPA